MTARLARRVERESGRQPGGNGAMILAITHNDGMLNADDNNISVAIVPDVHWATREEWQAWLDSPVEEQWRVTDVWRSRHGVALSRFERLAHSGIVSLADESPTDAEIMDHGRALALHGTAVDDAVNAVEVFPVRRDCGRNTTELGEAFSGHYHRTRYLPTHAAILDWARSVLG